MEQKVSKKTLPPGITEEKIAAWKKEYGNIFLYKSVDGKYCILRNPTLQILDACRAASGGSSIKFDSFLVENTWVEGDPVFKTDDAYRMGLFDWLGGIIKKVEGELEEL